MSQSLAADSASPLADKMEHLTHSAHSSTQHTPPPHAAEALRGLGVLSGHSPDRPERNHRRTDGPRIPARICLGPRGMPQRGASLARPLP